MPGRTAEPAHPDLRLVAADLDGTLLDADGRVPDRLWPLLNVMRERGIAFVPASGRQYATLRKTFERDANEMAFIAENGTYVVYKGREVSSTTIHSRFVLAVLDGMHTASASGVDLGVVLCGKRTAFVERDDEPFLAEVRKYYLEHKVVADLREHVDEIIKIAVYDFGDAEESVAPALAGFRDTHQVVVSGAHWVDVMANGVNKGTALAALQKTLGVTVEQTAAFGDYLNDVELLQAAGFSYAMENAHADVKAIARFGAPSHADEGVITVLAGLLGVDADDLPT